MKKLSVLPPIIMSVMIGIVGLNCINSYYMNKRMNLARKSIEKRREAITMLDKSSELYNEAIKNLENMAGVDYSFVRGKASAYNEVFEHLINISDSLDGEAKKIKAPLDFLFYKTNNKL